MIHKSSTALEPFEMNWLESSPITLIIWKKRCHVKSNTLRLIEDNVFLLSVCQTYFVHLSQNALFAGRDKRQIVLSRELRELKKVGKWSDSIYGISLHLIQSFSQDVITCANSRSLCISVYLVNLIGHGKPIRVVIRFSYNEREWERSGSVVECLTRDRRAAGSSLTGVTALMSLSKTHLS